MILASGAFDGVHAGHVSYLEAAAGLLQPQEVLVVAVAPDAYIRAFVDRLKTVEALSMVDFGVPHGVDGVSSAVLALGPRLLVKGADWQGRMAADVREACEAVGTEILFVPESQTRHTSEVRR